MKASLLLGVGFVAAVALGAYAQDKEPLKIELPEPSMGGTPLAYWSPNLESEDYKARPPYMAPKGTTLVSRGKPVTSSAKTVLQGELAQITDGKKDFEKPSIVELPSDLQWVQVDLGKETEVYAVLLWHYYKEKTVYFDVVVQVSNDAEFKQGVTTLYNNDTDNSTGLGAGADKEYVESNKGRLIGIEKGLKARWVRCWSKGNTTNDLNHYIEIEVFGK